MKAPEKIYLYPSDRAGEEYEDEWGSFPWGEGCVEYVRAELFVEKACEYMRNNIDKQLTIYHNNTWRKRDEFIEAFRQFMEGE